MFGCDFADGKNFRPKQPSKNRNILLFCFVVVFRSKQDILLSKKKHQQHSIGCAFCSVSSAQFSSQTHSLVQLTGHQCVNSLVLACRRLVCLQGKSSALADTSRYVPAASLSWPIEKTRPRWGLLLVVPLGMNTNKPGNLPSLMFQVSAAEAQQQP